MFNTGSIFFGSASVPLPAPATVTDANNGLSLSGTDVVLGNDLGDASAPAALLSDREIDIDNFALHLKFAPASSDRILLRALQLLIEDNLLPASYAATDIRNGSMDLRTQTAVDTNFISFLAGSLSANIIISDRLGNTPFLSLTTAAAGAATSAIFRNNNGLLQFLNGLSATLTTLNLTTGNWGIGTIAPDSKLTISGNTVALPAPEAGTLIHTGAANSTGNVLLLDAFGSAGFLVCRRAQGTAAAPTSVNFRGFFLSSFGAAGYGATGYSTAQVAFAVLTDEGWSDTAQGTQLTFFTVPNGTTTAQAVMFIDNAGRVGIGVSSPTAHFELKAGVAAANGAPFKYNAGVLAQTAVENGAKNFDGTNESLAVGGVTFIMAKTLTTTAVLDFPSTAAGASSTLNIALTGAADGDVVVLGVPVASQVLNGIYTSSVTAADQVTVQFSNNNLVGALDPASGTFRVSIVKY